MDQSDKDGNADKEEQMQQLAAAIEQLSLDLNSVELNWKSSRRGCACSSGAFDAITCKLNCSRCGEISCEKCVEDGEYQNSSVSTKLMYVCKNCTKSSLADK